MDSSFIKDLTDNDFIKGLFKKMNVRIPSKDEKFEIFPLISYFTNITKGVWGEIIIGSTLDHWGFTIKKLQDDIYELFDSVMYCPDELIYLDFKNYLNTSEKIYDINKTVQNKVLQIRENYHEYDDKQISVVYINLYNNINNTVETRPNGLICKNKELNYTVFDIGSLFMKINQKAKLNENINNSLKNIINGDFND